MIANNERGLSLKGLKNFRLSANDAEEGSAPPSKDHRKEVNPYLSKYGLDQWEAELDKSTYMSSYVSIKKLIEHMYNATNTIFEGTTHEDDWVWYHDALLLMTSKETIQWIKEKDYYNKCKIKFTINRSRIGTIFGVTNRQQSRVNAIG